jgi:hypothetical protein
MSFSGQYASFTPDPVYNKREWFNERGGYLIRSRFYPSFEDNNNMILPKNYNNQKNQNNNIKYKNNLNNENIKNNNGQKLKNKNKNMKKEDYIERDIGYIKEDRIEYNQPSNFINFLNYYFKNLLR